MNTFVNKGSDSETYPKEWSIPNFCDIYLPPDDDTIPLSKEQNMWKLWTFHDPKLMY